MIHQGKKTQCKKNYVLEYGGYAYLLQFVSLPYPSPCLQLDAQGETTF